VQSAGGWAQVKVLRKKGIEKVALLMGNRKRKAVNWLATAAKLSAPFFPVFPDQNFALHLSRQIPASKIRKPLSTAKRLHI